MLKKLFSVPEKEKITDIVFSRVLISSVFGILLSMCCLVGTTWAWFVAGVESTDNVIEIATVTVDATLHQGEEEIAPAADGGYVLDEGVYTAQLHVQNNATNTQRAVYVQVSITQQDSTTTRYLMFNNGVTEQSIELQVDGAAATVAFAALWAQPADAQPVENNTIAAMVTDDAETTTSTTEAENTTTVADTDTTTEAMDEEETTATEESTTTVAETEPTETME